MTVSDLMDSMGAREFHDWMIYDELSPFGPERADLRAGHITSTLINLFTKKTVKATDFIYTNRRARPRQSVDEMKAAFMAAVKGGTQT